MPTITVGLNSSNQITFSPNDGSVTLTPGSDVGITWTLPTPEAASIAGVSIGGGWIGGKPDGGTWTGGTPHGTNDEWIVSDATPVANQVSFFYKVSVSYNGQTIVSPDPEIVNNPPGGTSWPDPDIIKSPPDVG